MRYLWLGFLFGIGALFVSTDANAQKFKNSYYDTRRAAHDLEELPQGGVIFLGNSITEQGWWSMLFKSKNIINRGIGGDNTYGMIDRLPDILKSNPLKIFLMAGINDLTGKTPVDTIVANITQMAESVHKAAPDCKLYIQSVLPVNDACLAYDAIKGANPNVSQLNTRLKALCEEKSWCTYVDIASQLSDSNGSLRQDLTKDGIHLHSAGYVIWSDYLKKCKYLK